MTDVSEFMTFDVVNKIFGKRFDILFLKLIHMWDTLKHDGLVILLVKAGTMCVDTEFVPNHSTRTRFPLETRDMHSKYPGTHQTFEEKR